MAITLSGFYPRFCWIRVHSNHPPFLSLTVLKGMAFGLYAKPIKITPVYTRGDQRKNSIESQIREVLYQRTT